jgi:hypothetical protein
MRTLGIPNFVVNIVRVHSTTSWVRLYVMGNGGSITALNSEKQSQEEGKGASKVGGHGTNEEMTLRSVAFSLKIAVRIYTAIRVPLSFLL